MKISKIALALVLATITWSCFNNGGTSANEEHAHEHEESLQLTSYSDTYEVFAEATPFIVGHASDILAHFTLLNNFKPLESGKVTVSLIVGTNGIRQTLEEPSRTGIYGFTLSPEKAGKGKLVFDIESASGNSTVTVFGITVYTDEHDAFHAAAEAAASSSNGAVFTKEQSWKVDFATEEARNEPFGQIIRATAQIQPSQGDERIIVAKTSGIVSFAGQNIIDGKQVGAGQALFSIESSGMADNNLSIRFSEAKAEYERAKSEYERKSELAKDKLITQSTLTSAKTEFTNAETIYNTLRSNFSSGRQTISSPIAGYVRQVMVRNGEFAEAGQAVLAVSQNRDLMIKAEIQPKYFSVLSNINSANIRVMNSGKVYSLEELDGKVVSYGKSSDMENPLIPVTFQVRNSVDLLSGSFVEMFIKTQTANHSVTVPNGAIIEEMGNYLVFTQLTPEFFEKRPVVKGATDGYRTEIIEGVAAGDRVVSKGAILVKLAQASGALDAHSGHVH